MTRIYAMHYLCNESAAARHLLSYVLVKDYGINNAVIGEEPFGRPVIEGQDKLHISISHSGGTVLVAVSDCYVGVDVQMIVPPKRRVVEKLFTKDERQYAGDDPQRFSEIWARKESYCKMKGIGVTAEAALVDTLTGENTGGAVFASLCIPDAAAYVCHEGGETFFCTVTEDEINL